MTKKLILGAAALAAGLTIAAPAFADRDDRRHGHYKHQYHWKHQGKHFAHRPIVVMPPPRAYYAPRPRVYYAPPPRASYYAPPPRVYYAPPPRPIYHAPAPASGISIRLHFPL